MLTYTQPFSLYIGASQKGCTHSSSTRYMLIIPLGTQHCMKASIYHFTISEGKSKFHIFTLKTRAFSPVSSAQFKWISIVVKGWANTLQNTCSKYYDVETTQHANRPTEQHNINIMSTSFQRSTSVEKPDINITQSAEHNIHILLTFNQIVQLGIINAPTIQLFPVSKLTSCPFCNTLN